MHDGLPEDWAKGLVQRLVVAKPELANDDATLNEVVEQWLRDTRDSICSTLVSSQADGFPIYGHYRIQGEFGRGACGSIFDAVDLDTNEAVAIKVLHPDFAADPFRLGTFVAKARALCSLRNPCCHKHFEYGHDRGRHFVASEMLCGQTPASKLADQPCMPVEFALCIAWNLAEALTELHGRHLVHGNLTTEDVRLEAGKRKALLTFFRANGGSYCRWTYPRYGEEWAYAPPEEYVSGTCGPAADLFALGAILYECLTGRRPNVMTKDDWACEDGYRYVAPVPVDRLCPQVPYGTAQLIGALLARDPARRPSAADTARYLEHLLKQATRVGR